MPNEPNLFKQAMARHFSALTTVARNFRPNWFTVTMGTGALALVLNQFPLPFPGLRILATGLWLTNIGLFASFSLLYAVSWCMSLEEARRVFRDPVMSMFLGAIPMGLATIVNGFLAFGPDLIGNRAIAVAHVLWWIDATIAVACGVAVPYFMFTRQEHSVERLTAVWLLPVVACEVAAVSAGLLAPNLAAQERIVVLVLGYVLWSCSVPLAMSILVLLLLRLALHKLPEREMGASAWLALGPIGTGALGLLVLGADARSTLSADEFTGVGEVAFGLGVVGGIIFWGYGIWWLVLAVLKTLHYVRQGLPFNLGWWGFTFPLAVYTLATYALHETTGLTLFTVIAGFLSICLTVIWIVVATRTLHKSWNWSSAPPRFEEHIA